MPEDVEEDKKRNPPGPLAWSIAAVVLVCGVAFAKQIAFCGPGGFDGAIGADITKILTFKCSASKSADDNKGASAPASETTTPTAAPPAPASQVQPVSLKTSDAPVLTPPKGYAFYQEVDGAATDLGSMIVYPEGKAKRLSEIRPGAILYSTQGKNLREFPTTSSIMHPFVPGKCFIVLSGGVFDFKSTYNSTSGWLPVEVHDCQ